MLRNAVNTAPKTHHANGPNALLHPGRYHCPDCFLPTGVCDGVEAVKTEQDAGGHPFVWTSYVGHYECLACRYTWSENFS